MELRLLADAGLSDRLEAVESELIDQYLEGDLSTSEHSQFERYFLKSPERKTDLALTSALGNAIRARASDKRPATRPAISETRQATPHYFSSIYLKAAALVIIALSVGLGTWFFIFRGRTEGQAMADLRAAYRGQRLIEARVTGLEYAPRIVMRGTEDSKVDQAALRQAELRLLENLRERPDAKARHELGRFYLAGGEFDKAVENLGEALRQQPGEAQIQGDLGAALLEAGQQAARRDDEGKALAQLAESLQHLNDALRSDPSLLEAMYNKALCLQHLKLTEQAKEAWQNYLARDSQSPWAEEARRNLRSLLEQTSSQLGATQLLESFLAAFSERDESRAWQIISRNREMITGRIILPQLGREFVVSRLNGAEERARESLRAFVFASELEKLRGGDPYTSELAQYYSSTSDDQLRLINSGYENQQEGYKLCLETKYSEALSRFEAARASYRRARDVWEAKLVDYWIGYCLTQIDKVTDSIGLLEDLTAFCEVRGYKWLQAHAAYWLAVNQSVRGEHSSAIGNYRRAFELAEGVSDAYLAQKAATDLGAEFADLRQWKPSLGFFYRSLSLAAEAGASPRQASRNFTTAAAALFALKHYGAAAAMCQEALTLDTDESRDPSLNYHLRLNLGRIYIKLRRFEDAVREAELGMQIAQSTQDTTAKRKFMAYAQLQLAEIRREGGYCARALEDYDRAIDLYGEMEFDVYRYAAYKGRLLCSLARSDEANVERDLPHLLQLFELKRAQIREEQNRNSFFDAEQDVYDVAMEHEQGKRNYLKAISYSERARARSLLDALQSESRVVQSGADQDVVFSTVTSPADVEFIRQHLPPQVRVLMYTVLPTKLLVWDISRDGIATLERDIPAESLESEVARYLDSLKDTATGSGGSLRQMSERLYEILLGGVERNLTQGQQLCIIPDKFLYRLPFASLISRTTGKYLVEAHAISYSPSLNVFHHCSKLALSRDASGRESVLSIGNPVFDGEAYPQLSNLPAAEREARVVAELYDDATLLLGRQANKARALAAMPSVSVVHFAGHYLSNEGSPLHSKMLMSATDFKGPGESVLHAYEILQQRFKRVRLVVLSACQTEFDTYFSGEGAVGLARAFIMAGAPLVVASQWSIEMDSTTQLIIRFHWHRRAGLSTAEALRRAQVEMLHGSDEAYRAPFYWAAFLCVGGYTDY